MRKLRGFGLMLSALLVALAGAAQATPIKPDLKTLLSQPPSEQTPYVPARAGWNGPEQAAVPASAALADLTNPPPAWDEVASVAVPDLRIVVLLALAIILLRILRRRAKSEQEQKQRAEVVPFPAGQEQKAA